MLEERIDKKKILEKYREKGLAGNVGFGKRPALLIIDMEYGFTSTESPLGADLREVKDNIKKLLNIFRSHNYPIFYTKIVYDDPDKEAPIWVKKIPSLRILKRGTKWVEIDEDIKPLSNEKIIEKKYASAFFETSLHQELREKEVDTLILTGTTTSGCVRATAVDGLQHGYIVIVPIEAVGDRNEDVHYSNLIDIQGKYGDVVTIEYVLNKLLDINK